MARVIVIGGRDGLTDLLVTGLSRQPAVESCRTVATLDLLQDPSQERADTVVYVAASRTREGTPDPKDADSVFEGCARAPIRRVVVLSSAAINEPNPHHPGLVSESRRVSRRNGNPIPGRWDAVEAAARRHLGERSGMVLTILRPTAVPVAGGADYFSRLFFGRGPALTLPGHDPSVQLLSSHDLAQAVGCAVAHEKGGVYQVAPDGLIPLRKALRLAGRKRVPVPRWMQRLGRRLLAPLGLARSIHEVDYARYSWTVSNHKIKRDLGFVPRRTSAEVLQESHPSSSREARGLEFDDFGLDKDYVASFGRTLFRFLHEGYWRIEVRGLENVPQQSRAVLAGIHRGFQPWDGVMAVHLLVTRLGRYPRFLIHPGLVKFPFLANYMTKLGGIVACQENAEYVLQRDELLGIFPEGIRGAFSLYRNAYKLGKFGRDEFVKIALRNRAPIVPFVTVGSAEIYPILGKIDWGWWKRYSEWPFLPVTPNLGLVPLPSKWHTQFLAPLPVAERYPPEAADDPAVVRAISQEVRERMRQAIDAMLRRRRSIFYGSVFEEPQVALEGSLG